MQKFIENLEEADKIIRTVDHMVYVTFPLVSDKRILLKVLLEMKTAIGKLINAILQYEYLFKRVTLYGNPKSNFQSFENKCAERYKITKEEVKLVNELFCIVEKHKASPMEFVKDGQLVILSENLKPKVLKIENIKEFLALSKNLLMKTKNGLAEHI
jgi:hypothetical protein